MEGVFVRLEGNRLIIRKFNLDMAYDVHINSLDEDNRKFVPDEVFETVEEAKDTIEFLMSRYDSNDGPFVYPVFLKSGENIGYVQLINLEDSYEIGYHIAKKYTCNGYAKEALNLFLEYIMNDKGLSEVLGICIKENIASCKVLEKCGFELFFSGVGSYQGEKKEICKYIYRR